VNNGVLQLKRSAEETFAESQLKRQPKVNVNLEKDDKVLGGIELVKRGGLLSCND
jgi:hypothetical protein